MKQVHIRHGNMEKPRKGPSPRSESRSFSRPVSPSPEENRHPSPRTGANISVGRPWFFPLFVPADPFTRTALQRLPQALDEIMPLSRAHRATLPDAIRELSALLTYERAGLVRSYWSAPRLVSAYLRYFLPWNLVRLSQLLPNLTLPVPDAAGTVTPSVVDLGSGPLTLPLALWIARPDWRHIPVDLVCVDTVSRPMELGKNLLESLAALTGEPLRWKIRTIRAPLMRVFRELSDPALILAGNVLNEGKNVFSSEEKMGDIAAALNRALPPEGTALFVEPGTRLGGTLIANLREAAQEQELVPLSPCPHLGECPLSGPRARRWCHFTTEAVAPAWLAELARRAKLPKHSLSLSFALLRRTATESPFAADGTIVPARILSDAFPVVGMGRARYACTEEGLAIIPAADAIPSGALVACRRPKIPQRDAKSGAPQLLWQVAPALKP